MNYIKYLILFFVIGIMMGLVFFEKNLNLIVFKKNRVVSITQSNLGKEVEAKLQYYKANICTELQKENK